MYAVAISPGTRQHGTLRNRSARRDGRRLPAFARRREGSAPARPGRDPAPAAHAANSYQTVASAFLEIAEPSIPDGLRALIASGADEITVVPYFLSAGRHVVEDIPAEVRKVTDDNPGVLIRVAPYLGTSSVIPEILLRLGAIPD